MSIIQQMLSKYKLSTEDDIYNALKEIFQEITLLALCRGQFFNRAAFYGGTALRILYGLNRFSEDLDFSLLQKDDDFTLEKYFHFIKDEFDSLGIEIELKRKENKKIITNIESAFLKTDTSIHSLEVNTDDLRKSIGNFTTNKQIKIKIEVDTNPPQKFQTESKTLLMPVTFQVVTMTLPNLYAGKMHAVLCRNWKTRVKGRDWYDFEWYVKNNTPLNMNHLQERMYASGHLDKNTILNKSLFIDLMYSKIESLNIEQAKSEVRPFIKEPQVLNFWNADYFKFLTNKVVLT